MAKTPKSDRLSEKEALGIAIARMRKRADMTQEKAAEQLGVVVQTWRRYEWGERDLPLNKLTGVAEAIRATREELLREQAELLSKPRGAATPSQQGLLRPTADLIELAMLPLRDRVQAGAWLQADDESQAPPRGYPAARDPRYPRANQWLSEVVGDSMNAPPIHITEGDLVHCVDAIAIGYHPKSDDVVEVERLRFGGRERELTIKQVEVTPNGVLLWPRSTNPRWREPLELTAGAEAEEDIEVRIRGLVLAATRRF